MLASNILPLPLPPEGRPLIAGHGKADSTGWQGASAGLTQKFSDQRQATW